MKPEFGIKTNFTMTLTQLLIAILYFPFCMIAQEDISLNNKSIPENIYKEAITALSFYPELKDAEISFKFKENIKKSTMQAQPTWTSFFKGRKNRSYIILISQQIQIDGESFTIEDIPGDVLIGWLGHELGHVMDYRDRSNVGMLIFGIKYLYSGSHIQEVERAADTYAIAHGMGDYILQTKNFILDHAHISEKYKERLRRLYMSPEEVMHLINEGSTGD
ncbi:hypothetical protein [Ulvibacter antarcticus]|uniref:Peptidase M48-like protein n=1 Tax=Ulvibacter antarcticus TaxID=442714 RepID=A0A3L9YG89_9FLAO|nr:hypothetical protein [Ulvibacter antarcticus]RMA58547.1 hypothetical protein BXY75_1920 [Ulvibacter antarcticus]